MREGGARIPRPGPRALAFAAYGVLALGAAFHFADEIDTDGVAYLRIGGYYAAGDLGRAVSAYWSPLYSWLLAPGLALGVPALLAAKLLGAAIALAWVHAVGLLARRFVDSAVARALLCVAAAAQGLAWSMQTIGADLLLGVLLTYYFHVMSDPALLTRPRRVFAGGLLGGLAYLAKAYALPFFLAHFALTLALAARGPVSSAGAARGGRGAWPGRAAVAGLLGFGLLAGPWVVVLSEAQGRFTFSTALARNRPVVGDANAFLPFALR
ncbi:MAG TPA: hypothetical protein VML54_10265, partial [Candidatus Limnocylindrales bacterium]|nr:hypothetical protein [Candidatus Limnocylindrales bacterium]